MAPEVLFKQNHGTAADFYAIGMIGYELMFLKSPYDQYLTGDMKLDR